jgi:hypothetical protein
VTRLGWHDDMPVSTYLADPCDVPSLSSSIASLIVSKSPWHAWRAHPKLGNLRESSDEQDRGTVIHALVLGEFHRFDVLDVKDFRTNDAKAMRDSAVKRGLLPIKKTDYDACAADAADILDKLRTRYSIELADMAVERVAVWQEDGATCRARLDAWDGQTIYDLKTTRDASPVAIERAVRAYDYHVQQAAYVSAVEHIEPHLAGRVKFVFLFVENDTNEVVPVELDGGLAAIGVNRWRRAVDAWIRCIKANKWPGHAPREAIRVECSEWASTADQVAALELRERMIDV